MDFAKTITQHALDCGYDNCGIIAPEDGHTDGFDYIKFEKWLTAQGIRWHKGSVPLRYAAMQAGLGIIRKNNFLYTDNGSFVSLFAYITYHESYEVHFLLDDIWERECAAVFRRRDVRGVDCRLR